MTVVKIIGITGSQGNPPLNPNQSGSGVGKDTLADMLASHYGYKHIKFANSLRDLFYEDFGLPSQKKRNKTFEFGYPDKEYQLQKSSPRYVQLFNEGFTELVDDLILNESLIEYAGILRSYNSNIFVIETLKSIIQTVKNSKKPYVKIVLSDVRQFNEFLLLKAMSGTVLEIWRTVALRDRQALDCQLLAFTDLYIHNNRTIESLSKYVAGQSFSIRENNFQKTSLEKLEFLLKGYLNEFPFNSQL